MEPNLSTPVTPTEQPLQSNAALPAAPAAAPSAAQDVDLIEPEWVSAVKKILVHYRHDPYNLARAMTTLREDYLLKRYARHIETAE